MAEGMPARTPPRMPATGPERAQAKPVPAPARAGSQAPSQARARRCAAGTRWPPQQGPPPRRPRRQELPRTPPAAAWVPWLSPRARAAGAPQALAGVVALELPQQQRTPRRPAACRGPSPSGRPVPYSFQRHRHCRRRHRRIRRRRRPKLRQNRAEQLAARPNRLRLVRGLVRGQHRPGPGCRLRPLPQGRHGPMQLRAGTA